MCTRSIDPGLKNARLNYVDTVRDFWFCKSVVSFHGAAAVLDANVMHLQRV